MGPIQLGIKKNKIDIRLIKHEPSSGVQRFFLQRLCDEGKIRSQDLAINYQSLYQLS